MDATARVDDDGEGGGGRSHKASAAMTTPVVQCSVPMGVGKTGPGAPDAQTLQFRGLGEVVKPESGAQANGHTISYAQLEVLEPGGEGATQIELLRTQSHMEYRAQNVKGKLGVPGKDSTPPATFDAISLMWIPAQE